MGRTIISPTSTSAGCSIANTMARAKEEVFASYEFEGRSRQRDGAGGSASRPSPTRNRFHGLTKQAVHKADLIDKVNSEN